MRVKKMLTVVVLMGICRVAHGDGPWHYSAIVTNVPDATHVMFGDLYMERHVLSGGHTVLLGGIVAPEKGSSEEAALLALLRKTLVKKKVNVIEYFNAGSRGASIYVTDDMQRCTSEGNINLMLVREGFVQFSGEWNSNFGPSRAMEEAQRLAQSERKGIWADFEPPPDPPPAVTNALADPPPPSPEPPTNVVANIEPPENKPAENKAPPWTLYLAILALAAIGGAIMWRKAKRK